MNQKARTRYLAAIIFVVAACKGWSQSNPGLNDPLLDLFVKKGYVTQQEAEQVEAEAQAMQTNGAIYATQPSPSFLKIAEGIKNMELYGDIRIRYENRATSDPADNGVDLQRFRYALRLGLRGDAFDNFYYGLRLETSANPRSPWVTMGQSTSGVYQGPFGKSESTLGIGQIYLGWHPTDWFDVTIGKMANPLYTTPMIWDSDINPEGFAERFKYTVGQVDFFSTLAQFYYADFNPNNATVGLGINGNSGENTDDIFMFVWQGGFTYHITPTVSAKIAATFYNYTGLQQSPVNNANADGGYAPYFGDPYIGEGAYYLAGGTASGYAPGFAGYGYNSALPGYGSVNYPLNQVGLDYLQVVEIPFELDFRIDKLAARIFGDFAYNLQGEQRAQEAAAAYQYFINTYSTVNPITSEPDQAHSFPAQTHDVKAYQIGFGIGSDSMVYGPTEGLVYGTGSHKHDWEFRTYWQHVEQYALDPNIIDSDFFEGRENMEGLYAAIAYALSDNVIITARYGYAQRINNLLGTGGDNEDSPWINPINHYYLIQADATLRF